jgi:hypothetical protein
MLAPFIFAHHLSCLILVIRAKIEIENSLSTADSISNLQQGRQKGLV